MATHLKTMIMTCITLIAVSGCKLTSKAEQQEIKDTPVTVIKSHGGNASPSPQQRTKDNPLYPPASIIISWHAKACGGFKVTQKNKAFVAAKQIHAYFDFSCKNEISDPQKVLSKLQALDQAYFWPDDIKQYWWLQKQQLKQHIEANKKQQALKNKMQETLSSLATIEQQLLLREETKEQ